MGLGVADVPSPHLSLTQGMVSGQWHHWGRVLISSKVANMSSPDTSGGDHAASEQKVNPSNAS